MAVVCYIFFSSLCCIPFKSGLAFDRKVNVIDKVSHLSQSLSNQGCLSTVESHKRGSTRVPSPNLYWSPFNPKYLGA